MSLLLTLTKEQVDCNRQNGDNTGYILWRRFLGDITQDVHNHIHLVFDVLSEEEGTDLMETDDSIEVIKRAVESRRFAYNSKHYVAKSEPSCIILTKDYLTYTVAEIVKCDESISELCDLYEEKRLLFVDNEKHRELLSEYGFDGGVVNNNGVFIAENGEVDLYQLQEFLNYEQDQKLNIHPTQIKNNFINKIYSPKYTEFEWSEVITFNSIGNNDYYIEIPVRSKPRGIDNFEKNSASERAWACRLKTHNVAKVIDTTLHRYMNTNENPASLLILSLTDCLIVININPIIRSEDIKEVYARISPTFTNSVFYTFIQNMIDVNVDTDGNVTKNLNSGLYESDFCLDDLKTNSCMDDFLKTLPIGNRILFKATYFDINLIQNIGFHYIVEK